MSKTQAKLKGICPINPHKLNPHQLLKNKYTKSGNIQFNKIY